MNRIENGILLTMAFLFGVSFGLLIEIFKDAAEAFKNFGNDDFDDII